MTYEQLDVLSRHYKLLLPRIEELIALSKQSDFSVNVSMAKREGTSLNALITSSDQLSRCGDRTAMPRDLQQFASNELNAVSKVVTTFDHMFHWLSLVETYLRDFRDVASSVDIHWGLLMANPVLQLFTGYCQIVHLAARVQKHLRYSWAVAKMGVLWNPAKIASDLKSADVFLTSKPSDYIVQRLAFMKPLMNSVLGILCPIFTSVLGSYVTFDWAVLSFDGKDDVKSKSSMPSESMIVFQELSLMIDTALWAWLSFPDLFRNNARYVDLIKAVIGHSRSIHLGVKLRVDLKDLMGEEKEPWLDDSLSKEAGEESKAAHATKAKILCALLEDYQDRANVDPSVLAVSMDEILAIFGMAYAEISAFIDWGVQSAEFLGLLATMVELINTFENSQFEIQRVFLFNLCQSDVPYMRDLIQVFAQRTDEESNNILFHAKEMCDELEKLDLSAFDRGMRYDFVPLVTTAGRLVAYYYDSRSRDESLACMSPLVEHMVTITRHAEGCQDPMKIVLNTAPFHDLEKHLADLLALMATSTRYTYFPMIIQLFRLIPVSPKTTILFERFIEKLLDTVIPPFVDMVAVPSKNVQIARQSTIDPGFIPSAFLPLHEFKSESYDHYSAQLNTFSWILSIIQTIPPVVKHGKEVQFRTRFVSKFFPALYAKILEADTHPLIIQSTIMAMHIFIPVFRAVKVSFSRSLIDVVRSACKLPGDGLLQVQNKIFSGVQPIEMTSQFLKLYTNKLETFIKQGFEDCTYEPLGRRFISNGKDHSDKLFSLQPLISLIQTFGITAGIQIDCVLLRNATTAISEIFAAFKSMKPNLPKLEFDFYNENTLKCSEISSPTIRKAGKALVQLGLILQLRNILGEAIQYATNDIFPGFHDIVTTAMRRCASKSTTNDKTFTEAILPGYLPTFLAERLEKESLGGLNFTEVMFFLGLIFTNDEWNDLMFAPENDLFTHNLHVLPSAVEAIADLNPLYSNVDNPTAGVKLFFQVLGAIADDKKKYNFTKYCSFVILVDHFPVFARSIPYGLIEPSFPYLIISSCYSFISESTGQKFVDYHTAAPPPFEPDSTSGLEAKPRKGPGKLSFIGARVAAQAPPVKPSATISSALAGAAFAVVDCPPRSTPEPTPTPTAAPMPAPPIPAPMPTPMQPVMPTLPTLPPALPVGSELAPGLGAPTLPPAPILAPSLAPASVLQGGTPLAPPVLPTVPPAGETVGDASPPTSGRRRARPTQYGKPPE